MVRHLRCIALFVGATQFEPVFAQQATPLPDQLYAIRKLADQCIISNVNFEANSSTSVAQFIKVLTATVSPPLRQGCAVSPPNAHGQPAWFVPVLNNAKALGVPLAPSPTDVDAASRDITREEAAVMLIGTAGRWLKSGPQPPAHFDDEPLDIGHVAPNHRYAVDAAVWYGLMPTQKRYFLPGNNISQGQTAVIMTSLLAKIGENAK